MVAKRIALLIASSMLLCPITSAHAQIRVDVDIGINVPTYPELVLVPDYPVYYDPRANSNYFFYDGLYWVYQGDEWYASSWYNGPWQLTEPEYVPLFVLRVPVRYYRQPPVYFRSWSADAPPRWGEHWGRGWEERRGGWDRWDRRSAPPAAPLPVYQRQYSGERYPRATEQQHSIRSENYRYQPHEAVTQQQFERHAPPASSRTEPQRQAPVPQRSSTQEERAQPNQQRQQPHPMQPQPVQQAQPSPPHQTQPVPPPPQTQRPETERQDRSRGNGAASQDKGRENRAAPQGKGRENRAAPQDKARENRAAPQDKGRENRAAPQDKGRENRAAPQDKGRENRNEERGQDHR